METVCVAYGSNPPDPSEATFNRRVAEDVARTLQELGWKTTLAALQADSTEKITQRIVFNLCDGDDLDRFGLVSFAQELEREGKVYTGSHSCVLALGKEKTLSWLSSTPAPKWWTAPPLGYDYIAKPKSAHGSLFITQDNIGGSEEEFPSEKYFFQELLGGFEFTTCFLGRKFLGMAVVRKVGIISRDDKWDEDRLRQTKPKIWDHSGDSFPQVRKAAAAAWNELLDHEQGYGKLAYGRVDLRLDDQGRAYVIDLNPNAYLGRDGNFYSCWCSQGGSFKVLIREISRGLTSS